MLWYSFLEDTLRQSPMVIPLRLGQTKVSLCTLVFSFYLSHFSKLFSNSS